MKTTKILLWDEVDHEKGVPWPTLKALPLENITPPPPLASMTELSILPLNLRGYLGKRKMCC
jgi:hypothetical protein